MGAPSPPTTAALLAAKRALIKTKEKKVSQEGGERRINWRMGTDVGVGEIFPLDDRALKNFPFLVSTLQGEAAYLAAQLASLFVNTVWL